MTEGNVRRYLFDVTLDEETGKMYEVFVKHFISLKAQGVNEEKVKELIKSFNTAVVMGGLFQFYHAFLTKERAIAKIVVIGGPMRGVEFSVAKPVLTIGRYPDNDIFLPPDPTVSRRHARITYEEGKFWIEDTNSTNGTFIGGQQITTKTNLPVGATFNVGPHTALRLMGTKETEHPTPL